MRLFLKIKNEKLKVYKVKEEYLQYLSQFDKNVRKKADRKYYGILVTKNSVDYCIPFTCKIKRRNHKLTINIKEKGKIIAQLTINNMIPVNDDVIELVNIDQDKDKYYLYAEIEYLKQRSVINKLLKRADNAIKVMSDKNENDYYFFKQLCCNYSLLEEKCEQYQSDQLKK